MKLNKTIMLAALVAAGLMTGVSLQAQDAPKDKPAGEQVAPPAVPAGRPQFSFDGFAKRFDLTEDQKPKVKPIIEDQQKKAAEYRADKSLTQEDRRAKMKELRDATSAKLKAILTPEQFAKWEQSGPQNRRPMTPPGAPAAGDKAKN